MIWGEATIDAPGKITVKASQDRRRRRARSGRAPIRPSTSSSRPARGRACCRGSSPTRSWSGPISRRWCPDKMPKSLLVVGSGAIGIEFASFYRTHGRRGDGGRGAAADPAGRGRRDRGLRAQGVREAGHQDHDRRQGHQARQEGRQRHRHHRRRQGQDAASSPSTASSRRSASSAISRTSAWKSSA